jgi:hypothetical protein
MSLNHGIASAVSLEADGSHANEQGGVDWSQKADVHVVNCEMLAADMRSDLETDTGQRGADGSHEEERS